MATASPDDAGLPGFCCLCGRPDARCLCRVCREANTHGGVLADWARELQRMADQQTKQAQRHPLTFEPLGDDW